MSVGAKAGIGAGVALAVIIILGLVLALIRYRRRLRRLKEQRQHGSSDEKIVSTSQSVPHQPPVRQYPLEADSAVLHEMAAHENGRFEEVLPIQQEPRENIITHGSSYQG